MHHSITLAEATDPNRDWSNWEQTVFNNCPPIMNSQTISLEDRNHLLAYAIPALSASAGSAQVGGNNVFTEEKNMILYKDDSKWPRNLDFVLNDSGIIWCHSDFILVPHFNTYGLFDDMTTRINPSVNNQ